MSHQGTYVDVSTRPILSMTGAEALDLLQRISTNDVTNLKPGEFVHTILTTEKAKIVDVITIIPRESGEFLILGTITTARELSGWIERFVIMEDIRLTDQTSAHFHLQVVMPDESTDLPSVSLGNQASTMTVRDFLLAQTSFHLVGQKGFEAAAVERLSHQGYRPGSQKSLEELLIVRGLPIPGRELSRNVNPHEAGLLRLVSFTKGCYIGQEVVARLDTYKRVQKELVSLALSDAPARLPESLLAQGHEVGELTSATEWNGGWIGLGYIATTHVESPSALSYAGMDGPAEATVRKPPE